MVMPMTSTKNARLASGFGVSNSMWPRWARSKIGSGSMRPPSMLAQRSRQVVEQFVDGERARNKSLLRGILADQCQRTAHFLRAERGPIHAGARRALLQQPEHLPHRVRAAVRQRRADNDHMIDRHDPVFGE